jgi:HK97 gp10 family phage protein
MAASQGIAITLSGFEPFLAKLRSGNALAEREMAKALTASAMLVQGKAKEYAPVKTGTLRRSITYSVSGEKAIVGTNLKYAPYLEFGTRAHGPKTAPFLVFQIGTQWIRTKRVRGIVGRGFFKRAIETSADGVTRYFQRAIDALFSHLTS